MGKGHLLTDRKTQAGAADTLPDRGGFAGGSAFWLVPGLRDGAVRTGRKAMQAVRKVGAL